MKEIPIDNKIKGFKIHLQDNPRVVLSAKFGDGKTYFLNEVKKKLDEQFYFITLYPVNYAVAKNEDVFEYIKRDILLQLANKDVLSQIDFEAIADTLFSWENLREVISFLLSFIPGGEVYDKLISKVEAFKKVYDNKKAKLSKYESLFVSQRGGIYEEDAYTKMIETALSYIKNKPVNTKKTVLIIEDLDRIDPKHLFRILNILGAHIDRDEGTNKFGFDNIIIVLDYEMTKCIFHHFYGNEANYSGYMSKFMSHYPFTYSIKEIAVNYIYEYIEQECFLSRNIASGMTVGVSYVSSISGNRTFRTLNESLDMLSVRDIAHALDNIEDQYITETIDIRGYKIQTDVGFVKFLALLKRLNINYHFLLSGDNDGLSQNIEFLDMLGGFMLLGRSLYNGSCFHYYTKLACVKIENKNGIDKCRILSGNGGSMVDFDEKQVIVQAVHKASTYVKDV